MSITPINRLTTTDIQIGDSIPFYSNQNGSPRKAPVSQLISLIEQQLVLNPNVIVLQPTNNFTITIETDKAFTNLILEPTTTIASGTVNIPSIASNGQTITVSTTEQITALSVPQSANAPTSMGVDDSFTLLYSSQLGKWVVVSQA